VPICAGGGRTKGDCEGAFGGGRLGEPSIGPGRRFVLGNSGGGAQTKAAAGGRTVKLSAKEEGPAGRDGLFGSRLKGQRPLDPGSFWRVKLSGSPSPRTTSPAKNRARGRLRRKRAHALALLKDHVVHSAGRRRSSSPGMEGLETDARSSYAESADEPEKRPVVCFDEGADPADRRGASRSRERGRARLEALTTCEVHKTQRHRQHVHLLRRAPAWRKGLKVTD